jgi:hypothetical protein
MARGEENQSISFGKANLKVERSNSTRIIWEAYSLRVLEYTGISRFIRPGCIIGERSIIEYGYRRQLLSDCLVTKTPCGENSFIGYLRTRAVK